MTPRRLPTDRQQQAFDAVMRCGGQSAAALDLGITQGAVRTLVFAYCWNTRTDPLMMPEGQHGRPRSMRRAA